MVGSGDLNGDGKADLVLQNGSGAAQVLEMDGTSVIGGGTIAGIGAGTQVVGQEVMRFISAADGASLAATSLPDTFAFLSLGAAQSSISGFNPAQDLVELSRAQFPSFAAVQAATTADGGGSAVIQLDPTHTLTLTGIAPTALQASNFQLV